MMVVHCEKVINATSQDQSQTSADDDDSDNKPHEQMTSRVHYNPILSIILHTLQVQ
jgi:hypothetical protein